MQVKVFYEAKPRVVETTRYSTYEELLHEVMKVFELSDKKENCRLRSYNVPNQVMQETYTGKESMRLDLLKIYPQKSLALEVKKDGETFTEFDPNQVQVKVNQWQPNIVVIDEFALKPTKLFVKKDEKLPELVEVLAKATAIPKEFMLYWVSVTSSVGKKLPIGHARCLEVLSLPENANKTLLQLRINEGMNLYVEDTRVKHPSAEEYKQFSGEGLCKWEIVLALNSPRNSGWRKTDTR